MFFKRSLFFLLLIFLFPLTTFRAFASEYFTRDYAVDYTVNEDGKTAVIVTVTLTNKTSDYYPSSDTINVGFDTLENVTADDPDGPLKPIVTKTDSGNSIELTFNKKVVGKDKALVFKVHFDTPDIARHIGKIWEINIPGVANPDDFNNFTVDVHAPGSFGEPAYIKPTTPDKKLSFTKDLLGKSGISIAYGTEQIYSFDLTYHLRNKNLFPIKTEIALPPTTNYQEVAIESMNPKPTNVTIDKDGNWLAEYHLAPSQQFDVIVSGKAKLNQIPKPEVLSPEEKVEYTKERPFWQTSNASIRQLANELKTPRAIYDYVVKNLHYDFNRVTTEQPRLGAVQALSKKNSAVCLEFTDLFIAIARAAGIPAREVNGYAHTENSKQRPLSLVQDILHAWPEYYDNDLKTWVMVDPTWGNTTGGTDYFSVFDFDHFAFVRKGINSQYPIPAGGYKFAGDENKKDISVQFSPIFPTDTAQVTVSSDFPETILSGLPVKGKVQVINTGSIIYPEHEAVVLSSALFPKRQGLRISPIPPFGNEELEVNFKSTPFFVDKSYDFTFNLQDTIIRKRIKASPFTFSRSQMIGGVLIVIFTVSLFIFAIKARSILISRQK